MSGEKYLYIDLLKSGSRAGLTYVQKQVTVGGKPFTRGYWIRTEDLKNHQEKHGKEMDETHKIHKKEDGKYTKKRHELHKEIVDKVFNECGVPEKGKKPVAILMGGGSASGKSTMRSAVIEKQLAEQGIKAGTVDADEIKNEIPEFDSLKRTHPDKAAGLVHEESSEVGNLMLDKIIDGGRNFIYDGTMKSHSRYTTLVSKLKKAGYEVHAYVADVSIDEAKRRSDKRAEETGRKVPHEIIESSHRGVPVTVEKIKDKVDSYQVFDNTDGLKLIASNNHVDPAMYSKFLEKGGVKYHAKANT